MRILYLYPREYYDRKMSVGRVLYGEAVARQPGIELKFWGEGWPGYDNELSLAKNIERSGESWDALWFYKASRLKRPIPKGPITFVCFNECWSEKYMQEARDADAELVVFHHQFDWDLWREELEKSWIRHAHIPHCADPRFFDDPPLPMDQRPIDVLLTGVHAPEVYPLRARFRRMIEQGQVKGRCVIRNHPGYRLSSHQAIRDQYRDYCRQLGQAKVVLCCTSKHEYLLAKIPEAAMAGCAIVTDCPKDIWFANFDEYPGCGVTLQPEDSDESIAEQINSLLADVDRLEESGERARQVAAQWFTTDHYAQRLLAAIG